MALGDTSGPMSEGRTLAAAAAQADTRDAACLGAVIGHGSRLARLAGVG